MVILSILLIFRQKREKSGGKSLDTFPIFFDLLLLFLVPASNFPQDSPKLSIYIKFLIKMLYSELSTFSTVFSTYDFLCNSNGFFR